MDCSKVKFGSYDCYVKAGKYDIYCDRCLAAEIEMLNDKGIKTIGCCCGHMKECGYIQVDPKYVAKMKLLGYEKLPVDKNGNGYWCFKPKSALLNNSVEG